MVSRGIWINMHAITYTYTSYGPIDILYTLDSASNYSAI
jgi:hypothetical protein